MNQFLNTLKRVFKYRTINSYICNYKSLFCYKNWLRDFLIFFVLNLKSKYPNIVLIRSYKKNLKLLVWDHYDRMTVNEIYCWQCYEYGDNSEKVILDLGGNIGLSAKFFLNKNDKNKVYIFEPNKSLEKFLYSQLSEYSDTRYFLDQRAIGTKKGKVELINNRHSRYASIEYGRKNSNIEAISLGNAIRDCIQKFGKCDLIKIDIEGYGFLALDKIDIQFPHKPSIIYIEEEYDQELKLKWLKNNYIYSKNTSGIYVFKIKK